MKKRNVIMPKNTNFGVEDETYTKEIEAKERSGRSPTRAKGKKQTA